MIGLGVEEGLVEQVVLGGRHSQHRDIGGDRANGVDEGLKDLGRESVISACEDRGDCSNAMYTCDGRFGSQLLNQPIDVRVGQLGSRDNVLVEPQLGARAVPNGMQSSVVNDGGDEGSSAVVPRRTRVLTLRIDEKDGDFIRSGDDGMRSHR